MPPIDSSVLAMLSSVAVVVVQLVKGLLDDSVKRWIPLVLFVVMLPVGVLLAYYYGRDPVAGLLEGLFGFASAVGFYEAASEVPGVKKVMNGRGWVYRK